MGQLEEARAQEGGAKEGQGQGKAPEHAWSLPRCGAGAKKSRPASGGGPAFIVG